VNCRFIVISNLGVVPKKLKDVRSHIDSNKKERLRNIRSYEFYIKADKDITSMYLVAEMNEGIMNINSSIK
jgi:hypothetical protein